MFSVADGTARAPAETDGFEKRDIAEKGCQGRDLKWLGYAA
jgi:hypothetical protein